MDTLQKQVTNLDTKVDALHQVIEQLSSKMSEALSEVSRSSKSEVNRSQLEKGNRYYSQNYSTFEVAMEHKDVLVDTNSVDTNTQSSERELAPEIQIRRLTAQLTAAYNRIAALEEQLLSQRIH